MFNPTQIFTPNRLKSNDYYKQMLLKDEDVDAFGNLGMFIHDD
jgi:hypothetical protein